MNKFTRRHNRDIFEVHRQALDRRSTSQVDELMQLLYNENSQLLQQLAWYSVPDNIVELLLKCILRYVLATVAYISGSKFVKTNVLINGFFSTNAWLVYSLINTYSIPYGFCVYFVKEVVLFALDHIVSIPTPPEGIG